MEVSYEFFLSPSVSSVSSMVPGQGSRCRVPALPGDKTERGAEGGKGGGGSEEGEG